MAMSTRVVGFKAPDDKWKKMKAAWDACKAADVDPPTTLYAFFDGEEPDDKGMEVLLKNGDCVEPYREYSREGFIVNIKHLLLAYPDITHIKFYNSY